MGAGQFVEFILTREWNEAMKMMLTAVLHILNEDMIVAVVIGSWKLLKTGDGDLKEALCYAVALLPNLLISSTCSFYSKK